MRGDRIITPTVLVVVAILVVVLPAERSGWILSFESGVIPFLAAFLTTVGIYAILTLALNIQWGYTGVFNFGVAAFFLVGSYTAAIFTKAPSDTRSVEYIGGFGDALSLSFLGGDLWFPFVVGTLAAGVASGLLALLLSVPTLRLREDYLAIATIGVAELLRRVAIEEETLVNGTGGLPGVPRPFYALFDSGDYKYFYLLLVFVVLVLVFFVVERSVRSPWGRVLRSLKEDEVATAASGKNVFAFKMQGFVMGAVIMGMGGSILAYTRGSVGPSSFEHFIGTFLFWAMLVVGGTGNNRGSIAGAFVIWGIWTITRQAGAYDLPDIVDSRIAYVRQFFIGALIVIFLLLRPQGLFPEERRVSSWLDRRMRTEREAPAEAVGEP